MESPFPPAQEYFKVVDTKRLTAPVINVAFLDNSTFRVQTWPFAYPEPLCARHRC